MVSLVQANRKIILPRLTILYNGSMHSMARAEGWLSTLSCVSVFNHNMTQLWLCLSTVMQPRKIKALSFPVPGNCCPKLQSPHCTREWGSIVILMLAHSWWLPGLGNFCIWPNWMCLCSPHKTRPCITSHLSRETGVNKTMDAYRSASLNAQEIEADGLQQ